MNPTGKILWRLKVLLHPALEERYILCKHKHKMMMIFHNFLIVVCFSSCWPCRLLMIIFLLTISISSMLVYYSEDQNECYYIFLKILFVLIRVFVGWYHCHMFYWNVCKNITKIIRSVKVWWRYNTSDIIMLANCVWIFFKNATKSKDFP